MQLDNLTLPKPGLKQFALSHSVSSELASSLLRFLALPLASAEAASVLSSTAPSAGARTWMEVDLPAFAPSAFA